MLSLSSGVFREYVFEETLICVALDARKGVFIVQRRFKVSVGGFCKYVSIQYSPAPVCASQVLALDLSRRAKHQCILKNQPTWIENLVAT